MNMFAATIAFNTAPVFHACMNQVYRTMGIPVEHHVLNNHYAAWDELRNDVLIQQICRSYGLRYHDVGENIGLQAGYNYLVEQTGASGDDIILGIDGDTWPVTSGWGEALKKVMSDPRVAWASLRNPPSSRELPERGYEEMHINGVRVWATKQPCVNSICAWRASTLKAMGGLKEPRKFYGGIEIKMFKYIMDQGLWVFLPDFKEEYSDCVASEPIYRKYKWDYAHVGGIDNMEFREYRKKNDT